MGWMSTARMRRTALAVLASGAMALSPAVVGQAHAGPALPTAETEVDAPLPTTSSVGAATGRLAGVDRYGSAVAISRHRYADPSGATVVYLSRGDQFSDALTAGTLTDGPVLLTRHNCGTVPTAVLTEIERLDPEQVIALGGTGAVCDAALTQAAQGRPTARLGGATRADTAALIAHRAFPNGAARVYLTRGAVSPDAVVGGSLSDGPILLAGRDGTSVPAETQAAVAALNPSRVVALGGSAAVSEAALRAAASGRSTGRLAGADRYQTALAIARHAYPDATARAYLARGDGDNFVDAVASGMLRDGPVLLTPGTCEPVKGSTAGYLTQRHPGRVVALGGTGALCTSTLRGAALDARPAVDCAQTRCAVLTFDDGPSTLTPRVLDIFAEARVPGTFFVTGRNLPTRGQTTRATYIEGHHVGNHTYTHPRLPTLTRDAQRQEVQRVDAALAQLGIPATTTMRPPFLAFNGDTRRIGKAVIMTDTNPKDWEGRSAEEIRTFIRQNVRPGSVVIQHDTMPNTVTALPGIISDLKAAGYTIVTIDQLVPGLRPGDVVYSRSNVQPLGVEVDDSAPVVLDDGRVLEPLVDGTGELTGQ